MEVRCADRLVDSHHAFMKPVAPQKEPMGVNIETVIPWRLGRRAAAVGIDFDDGIWSSRSDQTPEEIAAELVPH